MRESRTRKRKAVAAIDEATTRLHIDPLEEGGYVATSPDVPGPAAERRSVVEAVEIAQGLTRKIVEPCLEHGDPLPRARASNPAVAPSCHSEEHSEEESAFVVNEKPIPRHARNDRGGGFHLHCWAEGPCEIR
jgi:predicted RNase H-like HicB family nuclease